MLNSLQYAWCTGCPTCLCHPPPPYSKTVKSQKHFIVKVIWRSSPHFPCRYKMADKKFKKVNSDFWNLHKILGQKTCFQQTIWKHAMVFLMETGGIDIDKTWFSTFFKIWHKLHLVKCIISDIRPGVQKTTMCLNKSCSEWSI